MSHKTVISFLFLILTATLYSQEEMHPLERALSGIVTLAVFDRVEETVALGFADEGKSYAEIAYEKNLDLAGANSSGSGFVVEIDGSYYVVTNAHVIDKASGESGSIKAFSIQRNEYDVKVIGGDTFYDIALLKFDDPEPGPEIQPLTFSQQEARLVQKVYAIGNPLGRYPYSITEGIISGKNRLYDRPTTGRFGFLQHTATLIWGNSGGPLVNEKGEVVGINTWIGMRGKGEQSYPLSQLNFALEGTKAQELVQSMLKNSGRVERAFLGVEFAVTTNPYLATPDGAPYLKSVLPGSPAFDLLKDYIGFGVDNINGVAVKTLQDIVRIMESTRPGETVNFRLQGTMNRPEVALETELLAPEDLAGIAVHFFRTYSDYEPVEDDAGIALKGAKSKLRIDQFQAAGQGDGLAEFKVVSGKETYGLATLGRMDDQGSLGKYQVNSLENLGAIIRLYTLEGDLGAILLDGREYGGTVRFGMQNDDFNMLKVLYY